MLLIDRILKAVERNPARPAFITGDEALSHRSLLALLSNAVRLLHERGVRRGDVVALTMSQSPLHCIAFLALARLGAISVPVFPIENAAERAALLRRFEVHAVVSDLADAGAEGIPVILLRGLGARGDESALDFGGFEPVAETPMRIALTSGTTGARKGFLQTHRMFVQRLDRRFYGEVPHPRVIPPNLHITASIQLACHALCAGGTVVFPRGYDGANFLATIARHAVTHVTLPPANLAPMLAMLPQEASGFPSIVHLRLMGITPSPAFLDAVRRKFSPNIYVPYSMAEVGVVAIATPETLAAAPRSSGRVAPGARLEVTGEDGRVVAPGTRGEIRVAVEGMPSGYCGGDTDDASFRDGWFHPRDYGYVASDGLVYVEGRIDEILNIGGRKVAPSYAESLLGEFPGVREAAVFAFEEGIEGLHLAAAIVADATLDWSRLDVFAREKLEVFAPRRYLQVEAIPRNARGKIQRRELATWVSANGKPAPVR